MQEFAVLSGYKGIVLAEIIKYGSKIHLTHVYPSLYICGGHFGLDRMVVGLKIQTIKKFWKHENQRS